MHSPKSRPSSSRTCRRSAPARVRWLRRERNAAGPILMNGTIVTYPALRSRGVRVLHWRHQVDFGLVDRLRSGLRSASGTTMSDAARTMPNDPMKRSIGLGQAGQLLEPFRERPDRRSRRHKLPDPLSSGLPNLFGLATPLPELFQRRGYAAGGRRVGQEPVTPSSIISAWPATWVGPRAGRTASLRPSAGSVPRTVRA